MGRQLLMRYFYQLPRDLSRRSPAGPSGMGRGRPASRGSGKSSYSNGVMSNPSRTLAKLLAVLSALGIALAIAVAVPGGLSSGAPPAAHPLLAAPSTAAAAPKLAPLPAALERRMNALVEAAQRYRGLTLKRRVPWGRLSEGELRREVAADLQEDLPPERLAAVALSLKAFGLIPEGMDFKSYYSELLTSQIAGFYDPHHKVLAVVDRQGGLLGKEVTAQFGAEVVRKMEDGLLVHELTHAIQDQHFNLDRLSDPDPLSDPGTAELALIEGDASLVMLDDLVQMPLEQAPTAQQIVSEMLSAEESAGGPAPGGAGRLPGEKEMAAAPAYLRDMLLFSYSQGAAFCLEVRRRGGQKLLDYAFATDPPRSSEQILHPEKWFGHRDDPIVIVWPDLGEALPGSTLAASGQLGEEGIRILLRSGVQDAGRAAAAAAGWGGDRFAVYVRGSGRRLLVWITDWDSPEDAARFVAAAVHLGQGWTVTRAAAKRVTLLHGDLEGVDAAAVLSSLAAARAEPPANRDIDLAKIAAGRP
jgi:hypothetical protein